jgi:dihydroneopterin aldolase
VGEVERREGRDFVADVTVWLDLSAAAGSGRIVDTLDHGTLARRAAAIIAGPPRDLIESVAGAIAGDVMNDERVQAVEVTLHDPDDPMPLTFADVSVVVRRSRRGGRGPVARP